MDWISIDPSRGEELERYRAHDFEEAETAVRGAHEAHLAWKRLDFEARARPLRQVATLLRERTDRYAERMTSEMGKPIGEARSEVEKCAWVCDYYAEEAERQLAEQPAETEADRSYVAFQPLGVVLAIMPWNFPFWQVFRFAAPTLMAGNGAVLKHAPNVPGCAQDIEELFCEAGFPRPLFRSLFISTDETARLMEHRLVRAVTLTGSVGAGKAVAEKAGSLVKKTVLELGGSDPYLVLEDADVGEAARICVTSRLINSGQSCIAAKRFIVVDAVHDAFVTEVRRRMAEIRVGDPADPDTEVGPLARADLRDELHRQVRESVEAGATLELGGEIPEGPGFFYPCTLLTGVTREMPAGSEELFGPVASVIRVRDEAEAIREANATRFGLGAAVFTSDLEKGERIARDELEAGACFVNGFVRSDPRLPFGGIRESGYGRELSAFGIREFVNVKAVWLAEEPAEQ